jgi:hypothetical protein
MRFVGKWFHKLQDFSEYKDLEQEISELQKYDAKVLGGLQQAFGQSMSDYARMHEGKFREVLLSLHDICRAEVGELRNLLSTTGSFPSDLKVVDDYHQGISKKRLELREIQETYDKSQNDVKQAMNTLEKSRKIANTKEIAKNQTLYDQACAKKQSAYEVLEKKKEEVEKSELEYRQTVMQVVIAAFEAYATANMKSYGEIEKMGESMQRYAESIEDVPDDPTIGELEARLRLLETEDQE